MSTLSVVFMDPGVKISLQAVQVHVQLLAERHLVKLLQDRLVEAFTDAIGLR